jgi:hypothetical protein
VHLILSVLGTAAQIPSIAWAGTSSRMEASSFSGLLTRVEIGHIRRASDSNARIGVSAYPSLVVDPMQDHRHAIVDLTYQFVRVCSDDRKGAHPLARGAFPVLPERCHAEGRAVLHRDGVGLFRFALDSLPFEEAINRYDAAPAFVGFSKHRLQVHSLDHRIDRASAIRRCAGSREGAPSVLPRRHMPFRPYLEKRFLLWIFR